MVLIHDPLFRIDVVPGQVSVPLRGLWFLSSIFKSSKKTANISVSVPLRGLWFLSFKMTSPRSSSFLVTFPSPCGDYGSYHSISTYSVTATSAGVSVPLRGLWFLSRTDTAEVGRNPGGFPSPCGDYGSYRFELGTP